MRAQEAHMEQGFLFFFFFLFTRLDLKIAMLAA